MDSMHPDVHVHITRKDIQKGLMVRKPRQNAYRIVRIHGNPRKGFCDVVLEGHGQTFRVMADRLVAEWERA